MSRRAPALASFFGVMVLSLAGYVLLLAPVQQSLAATNATIVEVDRLDDPALPTGGHCTADADDCSLRGAISIASAYDTIQLTMPGIITLTQGAITITKNLTITAANALDYVIDGKASDRIFLINGGHTVKLQGMTLQNGAVTNENGGAISMSAGTLTMTQMVLQDNHATIFAPGLVAWGGALSVNVFDGTANLFLSDVTFRGNEVGGLSFIGGVKGGAISISPGISSTANITIEDSLFEENIVSIFGTISTSGDGGAISIDTSNGNNAHAAVTIRGSSFIKNSAGGRGGAISSAAQSDGSEVSLTITDTTFMSNTAVHEAGAIINFSFGSNATAHISHSTFASNQATGYEFADSTWEGNGGAISNRAVLTDAVAELELVNVTLSHNRAFQTGGAVLTSGDTNGDSNVIITNATLIGNHAEAEDGNDIGHASGIAAVYLRNSILASDEGDVCSGTGLAITGENNLIADISCGATSPFRLGAPMGVFPTLADNGGPTLTHSFYAESNALNAVPAGECTLGNSTTVLLVDQRGEARPFGAACDIGALEVQNETLPALFTPTPTFTPTNTPTNTPTQTPTPTSTMDPDATATLMPTPTRTVDPDATPSPTALFNNYLPNTTK